MSVLVKTLVPRLNGTDDLLHQDSKAFLYFNFPFYVINTKTPHLVRGVADSKFRQGLKNSV